MATPVRITLDETDFDVVKSFSIAMTDSYRAVYYRYEGADRAKQGWKVYVIFNKKDKPMVAVLDTKLGITKTVVRDQKALSDFLTLLSLKALDGRVINLRR